MRWLEALQAENAWNDALKQDVDLLRAQNQQPSIFDQVWRSAAEKCIAFEKYIMYASFFTTLFTSVGAIVLTWNYADWFSSESPKFITAVANIVTIFNAVCTVILFCLQFQLEKNTNS